MTAPTKGTAFGLARVDLVTPGETPAYLQIMGMVSGEWKSDTETVEVPGDDAIIALWNHGLKGELNLKGTVVDLEVTEAITGNTLFQDAGPPERAYIYGGTANDLASTEFMLRLQQRAKHPTTGQSAIHQVHFFRCVGTIRPTGMKYGEATEVVIEAKLLQSTTDEKGATIDPAMWREEFVSVTGG